MRQLAKCRFEALSDGVFAIVMTLLVLDLKVPIDLDRITLGGALRAQTHDFASFLVTFGIASIFWVMQHQLFDLMEGMSFRTLFPTFSFLGFVSLLPFTTSVWGHHSDDRTALMIYFGNQALIALALLAKFLIAKQEGLIKPGARSGVLALRLSFMILIMLSGLVSARVLQITYVWVAPAALGLLGRWLRVVVSKRYGQEQA